MHHYFEAITNNKGDALTGYYVRLVDSGGAGVTLYADTSLTPIVSVSGVTDAAKVDADGNVDFYVAVGTYTLNIYATDSTTLVRSIANVGMNIDMDTAAAAVTAQTAAAASAAAAATSETNALAALSSVAVISNATAHAANRTALAALNSALGPAYLAEAGREGTFVWSSADNSANVTADTAQGIYVPPTGGNGSTGAWVRKSAILTPFHFGAVGDGATDDTTALSAFCAVVFNATPRKEYADFSGNFAISGNLIIGPSSASSAAVQYKMGGNLRIKQLTATFETLRVRNLNTQFFDGSISVLGIGSTSFASRTCAVGIAFENCAMMTFAGVLDARFFWLSGVDFPVTSNDEMVIPQLRTWNCGSGHSVGTLSATYTSYTNPTGTSGSTTQRGVIAGISAFPASTIETYQAIGAFPLQIRLNGYLYYVYSIDRVAGTATVYPWIDPGTSGTGSIDWCFGGGAMFRTNDAGIVKIGHHSALNCGRGVVVGSLYGPRISSTNYATCGTGAVIGSAPQNSCIGTTIDGFYVESNTEDLCVITDFVSSSYHFINSVYELNLAKVWATGRPRNTGGTVLGGQLGNTGTWAGVALSYRGRPILFEQANLAVGDSSTINFVDQRRPSRVFTQARDSQTVTLTVQGAGEFDRLLGYHGSNWRYVGTGANGAPTGAITFVPPTGGTINGGSVNASLAFSGFTGPAEFAIYHTDTAQLTWIIRQVSGSLGYITGTGGAVTQATSKSTGVTLNKLCGQVTMQAAALAAAAKVSFVVTNSQVAATDVAIVSVASGGTANAYRASVTAVASGSFTITVENITAGSLSEAPVISFAIIRAVAA